MGLTIRAVQSRELSAVLEPLRAACGAAEAAGRFLTDEAWAWLARNPAGLRHYAAFDDERLVAHAAAVPSRVWTASGGAARFAEVVAAFELVPRTGLRRDGPYLRVLTALFENHGGVGDERELVYATWPSELEWRLAKQPLSYEVVRTQTMLVRGVETGERALPAAVRELARFDHQARWLWDRCAGAFGASAIRDDAFLNWRFAEHPVHRYAVLGHFDLEGVLRGYAVVRLADEGMLSLVDWLVPSEEMEVGEALLRGVLAHGRASDARAVQALLPDWSPWFDAFQRSGFLVVDSGRFLAARSFARKLDDFWLREHWWYTLADSVEA